MILGRRGREGWRNHESCKLSDDIKHDPSQVKTSSFCTVYKQPMSKLQQGNFHHNQLVFVASTSNYQNLVLTHYYSRYYQLTQPGVHPLLQPPVPTTPPHTLFPPLLLQNTARFLMNLSNTDFPTLTLQNLRSTITQTQKQDALSVAAVVGYSFSSLT